MQLKPVLATAVFLASAPGLALAFEHTGTTLTFGYESNRLSGGPSESFVPSFNGPQLVLRSGARMGRFSGTVDMDLRRRSDSGLRLQTTRGEVHLRYAVTDAVDVGAYHSRIRQSFGGAGGGGAATVQQTGLSVAYTGAGFGIDGFAGRARFGGEGSGKAREFGVGAYFDPMPELRLGGVVARFRESDEFSGTTIGGHADYTFAGGLMASATVFQYKQSGIRLRNIGVGLEYPVMVGAQPLVLSAELNRSSIDLEQTFRNRQVRVGVTVPLGAGATAKALNSNRSVIARRPVTVSGVYDAVTFGGL